MSPELKAVTTYHLFLIALMAVLSSGFYVLPFPEGEMLARIVFGFSVVTISVMAIVSVNDTVRVKEDKR